MQEYYLRHGQKVDGSAIVDQSLRAALYPREFKSCAPLQGSSWQTFTTGAMAQAIETTLPHG